MERVAISKRTSGLVDAEPLPVLRAYVLTLLQDEIPQLAVALDVVSPPVVGELDASEVTIAVVDLAREAQSPVAVAARSERREDPRIGLDIDRNAGRLDVITQLREILVADGERNHARPVRVCGIRRPRLERTPGGDARRSVEQARAEDAGDRDDRVAIRAVMLGRRIVDQGEVGVGLAPRARRSPQSEHHHGDC
jgi:hypothetical protein